MTQPYSNTSRFNGKSSGINKGMFDFTNEFNSFRASAGSSMQSGEGINDIRFVLTYGVGFVTLLFLGFLSGYCLGRYGFEWDFQTSMVLSLIIGTATLFVEGLLLIIRMYRFGEEESRERHAPNAAILEQIAKQPAGAEQIKENYKKNSNNNKVAEDDQIIELSTK